MSNHCPVCGDYLDANLVCVGCEKRFRYAPPRLIEIKDNQSSIDADLREEYKSYKAARY